MVSFDPKFFRIASTSEAETLMSGKAICLLPISEDKKVNFLRHFLLYLSFTTLIYFCYVSPKGMDTEKFKYKWGGEDWDLLDRVLNAKLEVERIKYPGLYHHYHRKRMKWN